MTTDTNEHKPNQPGPVKRGLSVFRWKGLIAFVIIVGGTWLLGFLFADSIARNVLESNLTRIQGAQVDVGAADVSWQPFGLVVDNIAFTDPNLPAQNALDVERASLQMDGLALLTGKVVFESMAVDGLRFNTERASPGRVLERPAREERTEPTAAQRARDAIELPSPEEALRRHGTLETETQARAARETGERVVSSVQERAEALPDEERLQSHRDRLAALQDVEIDSIDAVRTTRNEVRDLTEAVVQDRQAIAEFLQTVDAADDELRQALSEVVAAPGEDIANILATYNLSPGGQVALANLLLGEQWGTWVANGQRWYGMAEPWVTRLINWQRSRERSGPGYVPPGYYVTFPEDNPIPGFWLKEATVSAFTEGGDWAGEIKNLSSDQVMIDQPARMEATSTRLDAAESADLVLVWDRREDNAVHVEFDVNAWRVGGWQVQDEELPIGLSSATTQMNFDGTYRNGWQGAMNWQFSDSEFGMPSDWGSGNILRRALEGVDQFEVTADLAGRSVFPRTRWSSDLDARLADAVRQEVDAEVAQWEAELRERLDERRAELEAPIRAELARLESVQEEWQARQTALENEVLDALGNLESRLVSRRDEIEGRVDEERRALEERAREEQEALEERAREEREAAERRAREEAERRGRDLLRGLQ